MESIDDVVDRARQALEGLPDDQEDRWMKLAEFGGQLDWAWNQTKSMQYLEEAIGVSETVVKITAQKGLVAYQADFSATLEALWLDKYRETQDITDLDKAIQFAKQAAELTPEDDEYKASRLSELSHRIHTKYKLLGQMSDLQEAIQVAEQAIEASPGIHNEATRAGWHSDLAFLVTARFRHTGESKDLEDGTRYAREAVEATPADHRERSNRLNNLGHVLYSKYVYTDMRECLEEAIDLAKDAIDTFTATLPLDHPSGLDRRFNLAGPIFDPGREPGITRPSEPPWEPARRPVQNHLEKKYLDEAIEIAMKGVDATSNESLDQAMFLRNLVFRFGEKFLFSNSLDDLDLAIHAARKALEIIPRDVPERPSALSNLGALLGKRYSQTLDVGELDEAIGFAREAHDAFTGQHIRIRDKISRIIVLHDLLDKKYSRTGAISDLETVILAAKEAVNIIPKDHEQRPELLDTLSRHFEQRYFCTRTTDDLQECIKFTRETLAATSESNPHWAARCHNLGLRLGDNYSAIGKRAASDLSEAIQMSRNAVKATKDNHPMRPDYLNGLSLNLGRRYNENGQRADLDEAIEYAREAIKVAPPDHPDRGYFLTNLGNLIGDRFTHTGDEGDLTEATQLAQETVEATTEESDDLKTMTATIGSTSFAEVHSGYSSTSKQTGKDTNPTSVTGSAPTSSSLARDPKQLIETSAEYDDTATVLTDNEIMDVVEDEKTAFVEKFATLVHESILSRLGEKALDKEVKQEMRHLLKSFAIKLFRTEQSPDAKDISTFVRHYRNHITLAFQDIVQDHAADVPDDDFNSIRATEAPLTLHEIFFRWNSGGPGDYDINKPEDLKTDEATRLDDTGNGHEPSSLGKNDMDIIARVAVEKFSKYQEFVVQTHAFEWLLDEISKHARLNLNDAVAIHSVQTSMKEALGISKTTEGIAEIRLAHFEINWDPCEFVNQQGYNGLQLLECALTLSGTAINTQLLPCRQYLRQCWPNLGETVLDGILAVMQKGYGNIIKLVLYDDTSLSLHLQRGLLTVKCKAEVDAIIEVAEIMAWIGSSLREASSKDEVFYVTPCLSQATNDPKTIEHTSRSSTIRLSMNFQEESIPDLEAGAESGFCWRGLLGNPVIAKSFPVLLRGPNVAGLEVSLPVMALLLDAERLTTQRTTIFLKGFNAAAVPTAIANDIVHWHLVTNKTGDRLSYNDARLAIDDKIFSMLNENVIRKSRHVLGWTLNAVHNIGSSSATYDGLWTSPDFTASRLVLEKIIVQGGFDPLTVGVEAAIGNKDPAPSIVRRDLSYTKGIESLVGTYIVLYDTRDHRAWLANGASALLHLTRASLRHGLQGPLSKEYVLEESQLEDNDNLSSPQAAVNFLCDRDKLQIPILRELLNTNEPSQQVQIRFIDYVNHIRHVLEQLIDYQATVSSPGMALTLSPRSRLEGYKFMDIAAGRPITPCAMKLNIFKQGGKSWVDFTRGIKAVTLFGKGFGELMIPASDSMTTCSKWQTLPKGRDYLAVSTYDLARIIEERGDFESKKLASTCRVIRGMCVHKEASWATSIRTAAAFMRQSSGSVARNAL
ncbi:hypothetical protein CcaCcLH18_04758 [Colletotrichum camelliae]|nr:hypothetical protein CcaCcLH18_04758 [Colletotrichum camelliae]